MDPQLETSQDSVKPSPVGPAQSAASARALAARVAELETLLAVERAENARRLQEVDGHMRVMRTALQDMQADHRRSSQEREKLYMELDEREQRILQMQDAMAELRDRADNAATEKEGAAAEVVAAAIARAQKAESRLAKTMEQVDLLEAEVRALEESGAHDGSHTTDERLSRVEADMARRDEELIRAAEIIRDYEDRLVETHERARRTESDNEELRRRLDRLLEQFEAVVTQALGPAAPLVLPPDPDAPAARRRPPTERPSERPPERRVERPAEPQTRASATRASAHAAPAPIEPDAGEPDADTLDPGLFDGDDFDDPDADFLTNSRDGLTNSPDGVAAEPVNQAPVRRRRLADADDSVTFIPIDEALPEPAAPRVSRAEWAPGMEPARLPAIADERRDDLPHGEAVRGQRKPVAAAARRECIPTPSPAKAVLPPEPRSAVRAAAPVVGAPSLDGMRIEDELARDAFGAVFAAHEVASRRPVTVRVLATHGGALDPARVEKLLLVRHRNVVATLAFANGDTGPYLVQDRGTGERADLWVARLGALSERIALAVALQVAKGLREGAFQGLVHGALSPRSLEVDSTGDVRVGDVGVAGLCPGARQESGPYTAPELAVGGAADARADVFSLGAILHFLVTAAPPAGGDLDPRSLRPDVSADFAALVRELTAPDPDARPVTWDEVVVDLERRVSGEPGAVGRAATHAVRTPAAASAGSHSGAAKSPRAPLRINPHLVVTFVALAALAAAAFVHMGSAPTVTPQQRFDKAVVQAERLVENGDVEGARRVYLEFLTTPGDPVVQRDAARRLDALRDER